MNDKQIIKKLTEELEEATKPKWIDANERLPESKGTYLCQFSDGTIETYPFEELDDGRYGITDLGLGFEATNKWHVTYWQPLPEPQQ